MAKSLFQSDENDAPSKLNAVLPPPKRKRNEQPAAEQPSNSPRGHSTSTTYSTGAEVMDRRSVGQLKARATELNIDISLA